MAAEPHDSAGAALLQREHPVAARAVVGLRDLQPFLALRTRQRLAIADPAHRRTIAVHVLEHLQIARHPAPSA